MRWLALVLLLGAGCSPVRPLHEAPEPPHGALVAGIRPTEVDSPPPRFEPGEQVESVVSPGGRFRIHFTRSGPNAVALEDGDGNGTPDAVEEVARTYDAVASFYAELGYLLPPEDTAVVSGLGGDERFDVYLVDFAGRADGAYRLDGCEAANTRCVGHMLQENDFAGYSYSSYQEAVATLASHEFFHAVQAAYHPGLGSVASEGTAVWATERFDARLDDLEHFTSAYLSRPDRSLVVDPDGPALAFSYGASLFFQFLSERLGDGLLLAMWEESVLTPEARWPTLLETALRRDWQADFDTAFTEFSQWNLATGMRAPLGQGYARGTGYGALTVSSKDLPVEEPSVRVAPASTRYFEVAGGAETVSAHFELEEGEEGAALHLLVAAVTERAVLRVARADGPGPLSARVEAADATQVLVAVVDGRHEGTGRYGRLCIAGAEACGSMGGEIPDESEGCQAAPGGGLWALALIAGVRGRARAQRRT